VRVAHVAVITPGRCGLYETTRELVTALRESGVDSRLVDPAPTEFHPGGEEDRGALFASMDWAKTADVIVNHSGYDGTPLEHTDQPVVHVAHGRPRYSFIGERDGGTPVYSYHYKKNKDPRFRAVVTFWPEHVPYLRVMFPHKKVVAVQACVDLGCWTPEGAAGYTFGGKGGGINVVCSDAFRSDIDAFVPINTFALWARENPGARLHLYGKPVHDKPGWGALMKRLLDEGTLGEFPGYVKGLDNVYRAADLVLTAHTIDVRTIREAMACGCPVAQTPEIDTGAIYKALERSWEQIRQEATRRWNPEETARQFREVLDGATD